MCFNLVQYTGLFVRRMSLLFHKMTFSQVTHFQRLMQEYLDGMKSQDEDQDESMDSIRSLDTERESNEKG